MRPKNKQKGSLEESCESLIVRRKRRKKKIVECQCHSFIPDISIAPLQVHYYSEMLPTTALILCQSQYAQAQQATVSEGLAQGHYVVARVGFEPATLRTEGTGPYH